MPRIYRQAFKSLRVESKLKQEALATRLKVDAKTIQRIENGPGDTYSPKIDLALMVEQFAAVLGLNHAEVKRRLTSLPREMPFVFGSLGYVNTANVRGRDRHKADLSTFLNNPDTRITVIQADGGEGKTTLVQSWINDRILQNDRTFGRICAWSFAAQGTANLSGVLSSFLIRAFEWFERTPGRDDVANRKLLVDLLNEEPTVLILDGLEVFQESPAYRIGNDWVNSFLTDFVQRPCPQCKCIVTTRYRIPDLDRFNQSLVRSWQLPSLRPADCVDLLLSNGVNEKKSVLKSVVQEWRNHPLMLTWLAACWSKSKAHYSGRFIDFASNALYQFDANVDSCFRRYEATLDSVSISLLKISALFDGEFTRQEYLAVFRGGRIANVIDLSDEVHHEHAESTLMESHLLTANQLHGNPVLSVYHPIQRTYYRKRLMHESAPAIIECHRRLFSFYLSMMPEIPANLNDLNPLYKAMTHGCLANRHREAFESVWGAFGGFNSVQIHTFGAREDYDLRAVRCFLDEKGTPCADVKEEFSNELLGQLYFWGSVICQVLGRLHEAIEYGENALRHLKNALRRAKSANALAGVCFTLGHLSRQCVAAGRLAEGQKYSAQCVNAVSKQFGCHTGPYRLALGVDAICLHESGEFSKSFEQFRHARSIEVSDEEMASIGSSLFQQMSHFLHLLMDMNEQSQSPDGANTLDELIAELEKHQDSRDELIVGITESVIGRWHLMRGRRTKALQCLDEAVAKLNLEVRTVPEYFVPALLTRAAVWLNKKEFRLAEEDVESALEVSKRYGLRTREVECLALRTTLALAESRRDDARRLFVETKQALANVPQYGRVAARLQKLESVIGRKQN